MRSPRPLSTMSQELSSTKSRRLKSERTQSLHPMTLVTTTTLAKESTSHPNPLTPLTPTTTDMVDMENGERNQTSGERNATDGDVNQAPATPASPATISPVTPQPMSRSSEPQ